MSFDCPKCGAGSLEIRAALELPATAADDEVLLQILQCAACGLDALGVYRENRHGSLSGDSWSHDGYRVQEPGLKSLAGSIGQCPKNKDRRCGCETHLTLAKCDWAAMTGTGLEVEGRFGMKPARK